MAEKNKNSIQIKHIPKDAQVILSIMKDMGIIDYEPKVINQLLEFTYRYVTCILDDSKIYANHSKKKFIDLDDVRLAVTMQLDKSFTNPPPREVLLEIARVKNSIPLPFVKPSYGLRLPPDRYCLNGTNYKLRSPLKSGKLSMASINMTTGLSRINSQGYSIVKRPGTLSNISRSQTISMSKPVFKVSTSNNNIIKSQSISKPIMPLPHDHGQISSSILKTESEEFSKRKREDDDYDVS